MTVVGLGHPVFELGGLAFVSSCELSLADLHSGRLEAQSLKLKHVLSTALTAFLSALLNVSRTRTKISPIRSEPVQIYTSLQRL